MSDSNIIEFLKIHSKGVSVTPMLNGQNESATLVLVQDVDTFELLHELIKNIGVNGVLSHITAHDISLYMKGENNEQ